MQKQADVDRKSKYRGALIGLYIGDALAMPVHWYYNRAALKKDYGRVTDYLAPRNPHPDSILFRSSYNAPNEKGEILHDQARYWGKAGVHYHQFLKAGENTLNIKLCSLLIQLLKVNNGYDQNEFAKRYIEFMTTPGNHRDTYIEECHRNFFANYARGLPINRCGGKEKHIGGLPGLVPIIVYYRDDPESARKAALEHLSLTHPGEEMVSAGTWFIETLLAVLNGSSLNEVLKKGAERQSFSFYRYPFSKWLSRRDDEVVGKKFSTACYVEDSVPAVIYLSQKYHDQPEAGLVANTNLGGDNVHRGAVLGPLLGAENGLRSFPDKWIDGLLNPPDFSAFS